MADTKKTASPKGGATKRKPLEQRNMTTNRYIDDSEGVTVTKRPNTKKTK